MLKVQNAWRYRLLSEIIFWVSGLLWVAGGLLFFIYENKDLTVILFAIAYLIAVAVFMHVINKALERRFRCPNCGGEVEDHVVGRSLEVNKKLKLCRRCNILWQIGTVVTE